MLPYNATLCVFVLLQKSSSSESLSDKGSSELKKSFDAVVFDVLKVTPEEYAVSLCVYFFVYLVCPCLINLHVFKNEMFS